MDADLPKEAVDYLLAKQLNKPAIVYVVPEREMSKTSLDNVLVVAMGDKEKDEAVSGDNPKDLEKRIKDLQGKITKDTKNPDLHYQLSTLYEENKQYDEALESFKKAVENGLKGKTSNDNIQAKEHFGLARKLRVAKKYDEAAEEYKEGIELDPNNASLYPELAYSLRKGGKVDEAIAVAKKGLEVDPASLGCLSELAFEYRQKGEHYLSILACEKFLYIGPKGNVTIKIIQTAHYGIAFSYKELGEYQKAIGHLDELAKYEKEDEYTIKLRKECIEGLNKSK